MRKPYTLSLCALVLALAGTLRSEAQETKSGGLTDPKSAYDFGFAGVSFLPYRIRGVTEIVPGWAVSASMPTGNGIVEASVFVGKGYGIQYLSGSIDYRLDLVLETLPLHFLIGLNADRYTYGSTTIPYAGGWHYGGGVSQELSGPVMLRADFRSRYGPGNSLEIRVGIIYRLDAKN